MRAILFVFAIMAIVLAVVDAHEDRVARLKRKLLARQAPFNGPTTVTTTRTAQTFAGTVVETCTITLTPVVANGQSLVREERNCSVQLVRSSSNSPTTTPSSPTQSASTTSTITVTETQALSSSLVARPVSTSTIVVTITAQPAQPTASDVTTSSTTTTSAITTSAVTTSAVTSSVASSSTPATSSVAVTTSSAATTSSAVATSTAASTTSVVTSSAAQQTSSTVPAGGPAKEIGTQTVSASSLSPASTTVPVTAPLAVSATPAQAEASPSTTEFSLPGKKLEVLPIGLGVFAGISVIALVVVGLVTYERTKYRKAFRQRKLAEQGAGMGYSGMSERV